MHIGVLTHNYPRFPGDFSGTFVESLCQELAVQGERITVLAPYDPAYRRPLTVAGRLDLRLYRYAWPDTLHRLGYMRTMQADLAMRAEAYLLSPALFAAGIAATWSWARRARPDLLHAHWLLPNGFIAAVVCRLLAIPLVVSIPGSDITVARQNRLFAAMARFVFQQAGLLTANSAELRDAAVELGADGAGFDLIIYGTDPARLRPEPAGTHALRRQLGIDPSARVLLAVGRLVPKKGFDDLLRALAHPALADLPLVAVLVGDGELGAAWRALAQELGVASQVRWAGVVPTDRIGLYYNMADLLVMPAVSEPVDGLNVCVLDAMSCARPVVASCVSGNPLAVMDGVTGLLVPPRDVAALAAALATVVRDPELGRRMGWAGRRRIEQELGWGPLAQRYIGHFRALQAAQPAGRSREARTGRP